MNKKRPFFFVIIVKKIRFVAKKILYIKYSIYTNKGRKLIFPALSIFGIKVHSCFCEFMRFLRVSRRYVRVLMSTVGALRLQIRPGVP